MRLIDANALRAQIQQDYDLFKGSTYLPDKARRDELSNVIARIINAPIVEAELVRCGRWVFRQYDADPKIGNYHCSQCNWITAEPWYYCPNCGAKMAGPRWSGKNETN